MVKNLERINNTYSKATETRTDKESTTTKMVRFDVSQAECSLSFYMALDRVLIEHIASMKAMMKWALIRFSDSLFFWVYFYFCYFLNPIINPPKSPKLILLKRKPTTVIRN